MIGSCEAPVSDSFQLSLTVDVRFGLCAAVLSVFIWKQKQNKAEPHLNSRHQRKKMLGQMINATENLHRHHCYSSSLDLCVDQPCFVHEFVTLTTSNVSDVDLLLFETGSLADVTWSVVGDAVAPAHGIVVVAITDDVAHAAGHTYPLTYQSV